MTATRNDVIAAARAAFPTAEDDALRAILAALDAYGIAPHERERERVQLAILRLCAGDATKLAGFVAAARTDYRDVLCWVDTGPLTPAAGAAAQEAARQLIHSWGNADPEKK